MPLYLGLDCSTQGLTALVIDAGGARRCVVLEHSVSFDRDLPQYHTTHGVLISASDPRIVGAPPLMWAEALDEALGEIAARLGDERRHLGAIAGSAQQHGTVYLTAAAFGILSQLQPGVPLVRQLETACARAVSPVWLDSSTVAQCEAITSALGGPAAVARLTGSRAFERFAGPQIRKYAEQDPAGWARTARVHLVSSFLASLLAGREAPIDPGDGSGMNLMDIRGRAWAPAAVEATAPGLARRLPPIGPSDSVIGPLHAYWQQRYGWPAASVVAWSGDNPCSLVGTGIVCEGDLAVSLGTSDTVFALMQEPRPDPSGAGHVFGAPTGDYMGLTCFSNGALARERVRDRYGLSWKDFSAALRETPAGNGGAMMLPWFVPEITPAVLRPGERRRALDPANAAANVRAVVEGQMLAMKRHSAWMAPRVARIRATGGASENREILQVLADVFGSSVDRLATVNSAALGAALRAWHAHATAGGQHLSWERVTEGFADPAPGARVTPVPENVTIYEGLARQHAAFEATSLLDTEREDGL